MQTQFGERPEVHNLYAAIARSADMSTARRIATNLSRLNAGADAKNVAQSILERDALLGKPVNARLTSIDGQVVDLAQPGGRNVLLYFCSYRSGTTHALLALHRVKQSLPANTQVIYVAIGATPEQAQSLKSIIPVPGAICATSAKDPESINRQLRINRAPYVCWINQTGVLAGFGPVAEVPNLVRAGGS